MSNLVTTTSKVFKVYKVCVYLEDEKTPSSITSIRVVSC